MHFADWFRRHALTRPNALAMATPARRLTYLQFHRALHASADRLARMGVAPGETVALCVRNPALHCVLIAALNRIGAVSISVAESTKADGPIEMPRSVHIDRTLVESAVNGVPPDGAHEAGLDWLDTPEGTKESRAADGFANLDDIVHILLTPDARNAVGLSMRQLEDRLFAQSISILSEGRSARSLCLLPVRTAAGFRFAFESLWAGGTLLMGYQPGAAPGVIARAKTGRIYAAPDQYRAILDAQNAPKADFSSLKYLLVPGGGMAPPLVARLRRDMCNMLVTLYGSTELGAVAFGALDGKTQPGFCGVLTPWVEAESVDEKDQPVSGRDGLLRFRTEHMATAYLGGADRKRFRDGWFYPGHRGSIREGRKLFVSQWETAAQATTTPQRAQRAPSRSPA